VRIDITFPLLLLYFLSDLKGREMERKHCSCGKEFVSEVKTKLGAKAIGRKSVEDNGDYELRESQDPYNPLFTPEKCALRSENSFFLDLSY